MYRVSLASIFTSISASSSSIVTCRRPNRRDENGRTGATTLIVANGKSAPENLCGALGSNDVGSPPYRGIADVRERARAHRTSRQFDLDRTGRTVQLAYLSR